MSFRTNSFQQMSITDSFFGLTDREKRALDNSWAKIFAEVSMSILSIAVCDDNPEDLIQTVSLLEQVLPRFEEKYTIQTFSDAETLLSSHQKFLIVFLDIEMEGINGIKTAESIHRNNRDCLIFFVTNHEDYMDSALNKHAFRFWTKPINRARLIYGIESAILEIGSKLEGITVLVGKESVRISVHEIINVYHQDRYTLINTTNGEIKTYGTYKSVASQLKQSYFIETDKSCTVNMNYVSDYTKKGIVCSYDGKDYEASFSRRKYKAFDDRFKKWSGEKR